MYGRERSVHRVLLLLLAVGVLACVGALDVRADIVLQDANSSATVNTVNGMISWVVDGRSHLNNQWFWYRVGNAGGEKSIGTLTLSKSFAFDTNDDGVNNGLTLTYKGVGFRLETTYLLTGGEAGTSHSDIAEIIKITNTGSSWLDFHFFQYSDLNLNRDADNDTVEILYGQVARQSDVNFGHASETVVTPAPDHFEAGTAASLLGRLSDSSPTTLADFGGPLTGNVAWAFQWDFTIRPGFSAMISKDKALLPAPGAAFLGLLGFGLIGRFRRRFT